jgi:hypothetical protein
MKKKADDNVRQQLLDKLSEESTMVLETAYVYAKNYVLYGADITKAWITAAQQAYILEQVRLRAFTEAYDSFKKDYENRLKEDMLAMITEIQLEIEELYPEHQCTGELTGFADAIETITPIIQRKIDALKEESEDDE